MTCLNETRLNTHMQHLEDLVLFGKEGLDEINNKIEGFIQTLHGEDIGMNVTQKIDGAPAVLIGHEVEGYPTNFVGIKSVLTNPANAYSSEEEIMSKFGDRPSMSAMLKYCLEISKNIPSGEIWQGDCLFIKDTLRERTVNGTNYITFQPNKIIYAFPEGSESYDKVANSVFGICFHTIYKKTGEGWSQSFRVNPTQLDVNDSFYIMSPAISTGSKEDYDLDSVNNLYNNLLRLEQRLLRNDDYENLVNNLVFKEYFPIFVNKFLSDKKQVNLNVETVFDDFKEFTNNRRKSIFDKKVSTLKTDKGIEKAKNQYELDLVEIDTTLSSNKELIKLLVSTLNTVANIKMIVYKTLRNIKPSYSTYLRRKSTGEYIDSDGEGISISDKEGNIVKLVDRSEFSNANRDPDIESGFDHNESLEEDTDARKKKAVLIFGRMNPITKAHVAMIDFARQLGDLYVYLSHTQDKEKNPLSYDRKIYWAEKAAGDVIRKSDAKIIMQALKEIQDLGYEDLVYVCGSDRYDDMVALLNKYNNTPDKKGNIPYSFNSIEVKKFGDDRIEEDLDLSAYSASLARQCVKEDNFDKFCVIVPFELDDARKLFVELKRLLVGDTRNELHEDLSKTPINTFKGVIEGYIYNTKGITGVTIITSRTRHKYEAFRIRSNDGKLDEEGLKKLIADAVDALKDREFNSNEGTLVIIGLREYGKHSGEYASNAYNSYRVKCEVNGVEVDYFITIVTGSKKKFTFNKVTDPSNLDVEIKSSDVVNKIKANENNDILISLLDEATTATRHGDTVRFSAIKTHELIKEKDIDRAKIRELNVDFSEVFGAVAVSHATYGDNAYVKFPKESNAELLDYIIGNNETGEQMKVSAKAGAGAKASSTAVINSVMNYLDNGDVSVDSEIRSFVEWFYNNVSSKKVKTNDSYRNIASGAVDLISNKTLEFSKLIDTSRINDKDVATIVSIFNKTSLSISDINKLDVSINNAIDSIGRKKGRVKQFDKDSASPRYLLNRRNADLSKLFAALINNSIIIDELNRLFKESFGSFYQIYCYHDQEFNYEFKIVPIDVNSDSMYEFNQNCGQSSGNSDGDLVNNKLSIELIH